MAASKVEIVKVKKGRKNVEFSEKLSYLFEVKYAISIRQIRCYGYVNICTKK